jgi:subtilisin family serine protease
MKRVSDLIDAIIAGTSTIAARIATELPAGTQLIGKVKAIFATASQTKTMGTSGTGAWNVVAGPCEVFAAEIVINATGAAAWLILIDADSAPAAGSAVKTKANGGVAILTAAASNTGVRSWPHGIVVSTKLWAIVSTSPTTITYLGTDDALVRIDTRS